MSFILIITNSIYEEMWICWMFVFAVANILFTIISMTSGLDGNCRCCMLHRVIGICFGLNRSSSMWKSKDHNVSETGSVTVLRWKGQDKPTHLGPLERACLNNWQTPARKKQLINTRQQVSSVGDRNKITIKHMIAICTKHAHVKNVKNESMNLMPTIQLESKMKT
jgi:hypothetical protein